LAVMSQYGTGVTDPAAQFCSLRKILGCSEQPTRPPELSARRAARGARRAYVLPYIRRCVRLDVVPGLWPIDHHVVEDTQGHAVNARMALVLPTAAI